MMQLPTASAIPGPAWWLLQGAGARLYLLICRRLSPANSPAPAPSLVLSVRPQKCPSAGGDGGQRELGRNCPQCFSLDCRGMGRGILFQQQTR